MDDIVLREQQKAKLRMAKAKEAQSAASNAKDITEGKNEALLISQLAPLVILEHELANKMYKASLKRKLNKIIKSIDENTIDLNETNIKADLTATEKTKLKEYIIANREELSARLISELEAE